MVDYCSEAPCLNGGTCYNTTRGRVCVCPEYYIGNDCQTGKF